MCGKSTSSLTNLTTPLWDYLRIKKNDKLPQISSVELAFRFNKLSLKKRKKRKRYITLMNTSNRRYQFQATLSFRFFFPFNTKTFYTFFLCATVINNWQCEKVFRERIQIETEKRETVKKTYHFVFLIQK